MKIQHIFDKKKKKKRKERCIVLIYFITIFENNFHFYNIFITKNNK